MSESKLYTPISFGSIEAKNRMVMAPMTRSRAINNIPNDLMAEYYGQRASAGLLISEGIAPSKNGLGYARIPGLYSEAQIEGWKKSTDAVHAKGGKIVAQLMHVGRVASAHNMEEGAEVWAPSPIKAEGQVWTDKAGMQSYEHPVEMTKEHIAIAIQEYVAAAKNAIEAGFDGVEIHSASGYLPNQFLATNTNQRTDEYGGSAENRSRFVVEVTKAVSDAIGSDRTGIKLSPGMEFNDIKMENPKETFEHLTKELAKLDLSYLHVVRIPGWEQSDAGFDVMKDFRAWYPNAIILNCAFDKESAETAVDGSSSDAISFGSKFLANPDLVERFKNGWELNTPDQATFYTADEKGYTDYPFHA